MSVSNSSIQHPIFALLPRLSFTGLDLLYRQALALAMPPIFNSPVLQSDITTPEFIAAFGERLLLHHAVVPEPMSKKAFEYAFEAASRKAGRVAEVITSSTNPGADIRVDDSYYSLKTEAHRNISRDFLLISKLRESAEIQDGSANLEELGRRATRLIAEHASHYSRIFALRIHPLGQNKLEYELLEIPHAIMQGIGRIEPSSFTYRGRGKKPPIAPTKTAVSHLVDDRGNVLDFKLDLSDGKLTIANLRYDVCILHGSWIVTLPQDLAEILNQDESE